MQERLGEAHATLDLLLTMVSRRRCGEGHLESLCPNTLSAAIHGVMTHIEEVLKIAEELEIATISRSQAQQARARHE